MKFEDGLDIFDKRQSTEPTLTDKNTIVKMQAANRFPMPDALLACPPNYKLKIDSIMHSAYDPENLKDWAEYKQEVDAPNNSTESEDELNIYQSESDDERRKYMVPKPVTRHKANDPNLKQKQFDRAILEDSLFVMNQLK